MTEATKGVLATIGSCILWGSTGLFYALLSHIPPTEIFAHRTLWAVLLFAVLLGLQGRLPDLRRALAPRYGLWLILGASVMMAANWLVFVYAVQINQALEASLGYFVFPLVSVLLGRMFYAETLGRAQTLSIALAVGAVATLTYGLGVAPWIALMLALTFGIYGLIKKGVAEGPVISVTAETLVILPPCLVVLVWVQMQGASHFGANWSDSLLLMLAGPFTAAPLILFSYASTRITMASIGVISYLNPFLQFVAATLVLKEPFGLWHAVAFAMIWTALVIYSTASWRQEKAARNLSLRSATDGTSRM